MYIGIPTQIIKDTQGNWTPLFVADSGKSSALTWKRNCYPYSSSFLDRWPHRDININILGFSAFCKKFKNCICNESLNIFLFIRSLLKINYDIKILQLFISLEMYPRTRPIFFFWVLVGLSLCKLWYKLENKFTLWTAFSKTLRYYIVLP